MRTRHLSLRTEQAYLQWLRRYIAFHGRKHPRELGAPEVEQFLTFLAVRRKVSAATQNQALQALLFLYRHVLEIELPWLANVTRATRRHAARGARTKVSAGRYAMGLAVPVSLRDTLPRPLYGPAGAASSPREGHPAGGAVSRAQGGAHPAGELPFAETLFRDASTRGRLRRPHGPAAPRPQRPEDHHDLHPRHGEGGQRRAQSARPARSARPERSGSEIGTACA